MEREEERAREQAQSPFGASVKYDLFGTFEEPEEEDSNSLFEWNMNKKLAHRDAFFRLREVPEPMRMSATERSMRPVLRETRLSKDSFEFKMVRSRRERSGRESLLILSRWYNVDLLTFVDWGKEEEKVVWEVKITGKKPRYSPLEPMDPMDICEIDVEGEKTLVRLLIGDGYVGMLSTVHKEDKTNWRKNQVFGQVLSMRLRLFSKEDGCLIGDDEIDQVKAVKLMPWAHNFECGAVLGRVSGGNVLALCCMRDMELEDGPVDRIVCYVYDAASVLRRGRGGGGGSGGDKSIPRRRVVVSHLLFWSDGVADDGVDCTFRCGSILVLHTPNGALSVWDLGRRDLAEDWEKATLLSMYELNKLPLSTISRDGKVWIFRDGKTKEEKKNCKEKYLVITLHKSLGVLPSS